MSKREKDTNHTVDQPKGHQSGVGVWAGPIHWVGVSSEESGNREGIHPVGLWLNGRIGICRETRAS